MKLTFLGTGTSCGIPVIGCHCPVCTSSDPRDKRLRCSILVETETTRILVDCGPDFRQQIMPQPFRRIDAILVTHSHYDHVGGLDDVRPYCQFGQINVYADEKARKAMLTMLPYCFAENRYPGVPKIELSVISPGMPLTVGDIRVMPLRVMHGKMPILAFRFGHATPTPYGMRGGMAYITDMKTINDDQLPLLNGVETLVINALRFDRPHHSHQLVADAIAFARRIGARRTLLTHLCHDIGLHAQVMDGLLPADVELAYDGQVIDF